MVTGPWSEQQQQKGHAFRVPSRSSKASYKTTLEPTHPTTCFKSELHFKGEKKKKNQASPKVILVLLSDGYWRLSSNKMTHRVRYLSKQANMLTPLQKGRLLRDNKLKQWSELLRASSNISPRCRTPVLHRFQTVGEDFWQWLLFCKQLESGDPLFGEGFGRYF